MSAASATQELDNESQKFHYPNINICAIRVDLPRMKVRCCFDFYFMASRTRKTQRTHAHIWAYAHMWAHMHEKDQLYQG